MGEARDASLRRRREERPTCRSNQRAGDRPHSSRSAPLPRGQVFTGPNWGFDSFSVTPLMGALSGRRSPSRSA